MIELLHEVVDKALKSGEELGVQIDDSYYSVEGAIGEYQDYGLGGKELGPSEIRLKLDVTIPLDVVYLKLPPRIERKAKRMWEKAK